MDGVNGRDLQFPARTRIAVAKSLPGSGHPDGAYYLAGYAVWFTTRLRPPESLWNGLPRCSL